MTTTVATYPGPGFTYFARWIGRCPACKAVVKIEESDPRYGWHIAHRRVSSCGCTPLGTNVVVKMVTGTVSDRKCDARCQSAKGPNCECSCGGENHGHLS